MLELYHHGSSVCAAKVRFALAEKRLEWTSHYIDLLKGEQFDPDFLAINPKCSPSAPLRQIEGLHEGRISGSS
jgi:glutathione S-transferase